MTGFPSDDLRRFSALFALAQSTPDRNPPDYTFSYSRGPQLTELPVTIRTQAPGPIALRGSGVTYAAETDEYRELNPERDMTFAGTDGEEGNDDFEPAGPRYDNPGFSEYAIEHIDAPQPLLEGNPKSVQSIAAAVRIVADIDGYTRQQAIKMVTGLCMGSDIKPRDVLVALGYLSPERIA